VRRRKWLYVIPALVLALLIAAPALAAVLAVPVTLESALPQVGNLPVYGLNTQPCNNTFYAQGRHWVFYDDEDSDLVYKTAVSGGIWSEVTLVAGTSLYGFEWSVWYDEPTNTIHYARHEMDTDPDTVMYRMGTPNASGTVTWAAVEQTVSQVPADLLTWRTTIAVDENGYPWVAWIDTDNVGAVGIVYVESSSTKAGTWTENVTANFTIGDDHHAWFASLTPVGDNATDDIMQIAWSSENQTDNTAGLYAVVYNFDTEWGSTDNVVAQDSLLYTRPDAFSFYDLGKDLHVVYTDNGGDVIYRVKAADETWEVASAGDIIKTTVGIDWIPTLSGYGTNGLGEDLLCIVHNEDAIYYATHTYGDDPDDWNTWTLVWVTPDMGQDIISRHVASYSTYSPLGFAWMYTDDSANPDVDVLNYWWIDNTNDGLGYYADEVLDWEGWTLVSVLPYVFVGIMLVMSTALLVSGATIAGLIMLAITFIIGIVGTGLIQSLILG